MKKMIKRLLAMAVAAAVVFAPMATAIPVQAEEAAEVTVAATLDAAVSEIMVETGKTSGMYHMDAAKIIVYSDGSKVISMHQGSANRNILSLTDNIVDAKAHPETWIKGGGEDGYWFDIPFTSVLEPIYACMSSESRLAEGKDFGNPIRFTISDFCLTPVNIKNMVKAVSASCTVAEDGSKLLVFALNGTGYEYITKGTYDDAVLNGDSEDALIKYNVNGDGKYEFVLPIGADETHINFCTLSAKENTWYPRMFDLDLDALTLTLDDYQGCEPVAMNENPYFEEAARYVVAGPNSNTYSVDLLLKPVDATVASYMGEALTEKDGYFWLPVIRNNKDASKKIDLSGQDLDITLYTDDDSDVVTVNYSDLFSADQERCVTVSSVYDEILEHRAAFVEKFSDVREDWYTDSCFFVYEMGWMTGYNDTKFGVTNKISRAQIATILYRICGEQYIEYKPVFKDVRDGIYYSTAITWVNEMGIITGYEDKTFGPAKDLTREQFATILYRFDQNFMENELGEVVDCKTMFDDADQISKFAKEAMNWAVGHGIITGKKPGVLAPRGTASRAEAATMLMRYFANLE